MKRKKETKTIENSRGYFGIGIYNGKCVENLGTLWRSAYIYDASFIFTVGQRYKLQQTDTLKSYKHIPLFHFETLKDLEKYQPKISNIVCVELADKSSVLGRFKHPSQAVYLLGSEDNGIPDEYMKGKQILKIPSSKPYSLNVAVAGSIILYDRHINIDNKRKNE